MKRPLFFLLVSAFFASAVFAAPVDVNTAKEYGKKYVQNTLGKKAADLSLVYTKTSDAGVDALYVFNFDQGHVMVAADDRAHPILAYSDDCAFDADHIPEGLAYYLGHYARQIQYAIDQNLPVDMEIAEQWYLLEKEGAITGTRMDRAVLPLLSTSWDQGYPYNYYAPSCNNYWAGNHCYAGCMACSMSQSMKYWNWPETGNGTHTYSTSSYGGTLSVDFGATTYNWSIMPNTLGNNTNPAALAVALLMYHCGVAVNMNFSPNGSGAYIEDVPNAVTQYFRYGSCVNIKHRDDYSRTAWEDLLIASFDQGIPVLYCGTESDGTGGHAFNCDGYNNQRMFHFNWGWGGSSNNYYQIDALNTSNGSFNSNQRVVFDMIPDYIYDALVPAIETFEAEVDDAITKTVHLSFTVPQVSESGSELVSIDHIDLKRNGVVVHTFNNPQPGETIECEDQVDEYGAIEYTIIGVNNDFAGKPFTKVLVVGPNCTWKIVCNTTNFQGWNHGMVQILSGDVILKEVTLTSSTPLSEKFQLPEGDFSLQWYPSDSPVASMTISLKNSANQSVYSFSGSSSELSGTLYSGSNDCAGCTPPTDLTGEYFYEDGQFGTRLTWSCDYTPSKFKVYRSEDGSNYEEIAVIDNTLREYVDAVAVGSYYYKVTAYSTSCESTPAETGLGTDYVYVSVTAVADADLHVGIYPNPAEDVLHVEGADIQEVVMYNVLGQPVYRFKGLVERLEINTAEMKSGIYTMNVITGSGLASRIIQIIN